MPSKLSLEHIRHRLSEYAPALHGGSRASRRAAVAAIVRTGAAGPEVLLIQRAERDGDPWSGHMAFPGGHHDPEDVDLFETACREVREEVGLSLSHENLLGRLDDHPAMAKGRFTGMVISAFVFALDGQPPRFTPNAEVADLMWGPLRAMASGDIPATKEHSWQGKMRSFPGYAVNGQVVWGLTHRMLQNFFETVGVEVDQRWEPS